MKRSQTSIWTQVSLTPKAGLLATVLCYPIDRHYVSKVKHTHTHFFSLSFFNIYFIYLAVLVLVAARSSSVSIVECESLLVACGI